MKRTTLTWISGDAERRKLNLIFLLGTISILAITFIIFLPRLYQYVESGEMSETSFIGCMILLVGMVIGCSLPELYINYTLKGEYYIILFLDRLTTIQIVEKVLSNEKLNYKKSEGRRGFLFSTHIFDILNYENTHIKIWSGKPDICSVYLGKLSEQNRHVIEGLKEKLDVEFKPKGA